MQVDAKELDKEPAPSKESLGIPQTREALLDLVDIHSKFQQRKASLYASKKRLYVEEVPTEPLITVDNVPVNSKEEPAEVVKDVKTDLSVDYHRINLDELLERLESDENLGLNTNKAGEKLKKDGPNAIKVGNRFKGIIKIFGYLFGGFGVVMWPAAIMCFIAYRPLGDPEPDLANLGLGLTLLAVILLSAFFSGWQDWQSSKVSN
jgi:magnesium-transporting ATPase (P-type)